MINRSRPHSTATPGRPDKILLITVAVLLVFGLVALSSASVAVAYQRYGDPYYLLTHQLAGLVIGLLAFWYFMRTDYHHWRRYTFWFLGGSVVLLILVFIPGVAAGYGTSRSWINLFGYSLQPAELVKLTFLLYLAQWLESRQGRLSDVATGIAPFLALLGVITLLLLLQPDIGTLSIIAATSLSVYFVGGGRLRHILTIMAAGALLLFILVQFKPYQMNRFRCLIDPNWDTAKVCYQVNQSLIAVGSGGITGRGLGESRQKFFYLPEVANDSIFAVVAEEMGLVVSLAVVGAYGVIFYRGYRIAKFAPDDFGRNLSIGIVTWIGVQAVVNIGGVINLLPLTGVPLPFVSYGGSAILSALAATGILVNVSKHRGK